MRGIEHHRIAKGAHNRQGTHIRHQVVIAKGGAAFCEEQTLIASARELLRDVLHIPRRQELPFLDVHWLPSTGRGEEEIGLAAEKCRDLDDVQDFGRRADLLDLVYVR